MPLVDDAFSEFAYSSGSAREEALCQQMALITCLYWNDAERAQRIVNQLGGGVIVKWEFSETSWPPSYAIVRQVDRYYVILTGTMSARQLATHIIGAAPAPYSSDPSFAHPLWQIQSKRLFVEIGRVLNEGPQFTEINLAGHSWGGAVAQLLANAFAANGIGDSVSLITFGQPKAITQGYNGPEPVRYFRVVNSDDIVSNLPPINPAVVAARVPLLGPLLGKLLGYVHYGRRIELTSQPEIFQGVNGQEEPFRTPNDITRTISFEHSSITYLDRLNLWLKQHRGQSATTQAADNASALERTPTVQTTVDLVKLSQYRDPSFPDTLGLYQHDPTQPLNPEAMLPVQSSEVRVSAITVRPFGSSSVQGDKSRQMANIHPEGVSTMPASGFWKLTLVINNGKNGTSTSVIYHGTASIADAIAVGKTLATKRSFLLGNNNAGSASANVKSPASPTIEFLRVSDAKNLRLSQLVELPVADYSGGNVSVNNGADVLSTALTVRIKGVNSGDASVSSFSNHQFVGQPDIIVADGKYKNGATVVAGTTTFDAYLKAYLNYLTGGGGIFGYMGQAVSEEKKKATNWSVNTFGRYQCVCTGHGYATGDTIRVTSSDVNLIDGPSKIVYVDPNTFYLTKNFGTGHPLPILAQVQRIANANGTKPQDFFSFVAPDGGWVTPYGLKVSKKNLGREFTGVSFRRRVKRKE